MLVATLTTLFSPDVLMPLWISLKLATVTTLLLLLFGTPLAYWLSRPNHIRATSYKRRPILGAYFKLMIMGMIAMPLVLPPTVIGFYLLLLFSPNTELGQWLSTHHLGYITTLAFSFQGLVIGSLIFTLPFYIQPVYAQFLRIPPNVHDMAKLLEPSPWQRFWRVTLPQAKSGIVLGALISFAHTIGEFGVVLMIGGSIGGKTKVMSIAIYEQVEALNYTMAHTMSLLLIVIAIILITLIAIAKRLSERR